MTKTAECSMPGKDCPWCRMGFPRRERVQVIEKDSKGRPTGRYFFMDKAVLDAAIGKKEKGR